jgi:hypothetical protein
MADTAPPQDPTSTTTALASLSAAPDPEVAAIGKVNDALLPLEPAVRQRVLYWAAQRFEVILPKGKTSASGNGGADGKEEEEQDAEQLGTVTPGAFADVASLYDAANPTTEADKALVVGYWFQVVQGNADFTGFSVNKELSNLGHGVKNITVALGSLIDSTPRLVIQTHKSGKSKQARKKYKVTGEGIKRVKQLLAGNGGQE